ncbi:ABC transporter substrate-binding protein [uncultured Gimesia sp.]|jgi:iron complex transport system substrate-binding protein|uniref:ABC transporter substrate-binding protein n=1 Tax=uncultured Gimesia sp. TaxID=1678688 RepID=UPI00262C14E9|nr:cobalamin-binding protein [uncultured Gimesia sp.]
MNKFDPRLILIFLALWASAGCGSEKSEQNLKSGQITASSTKKQNPSGFPATVKDDRGVEVAIAQKPVRIVSLLPSHTEILFAIGAGEQMVGCTTYCNYPAETEQLKKVALSSPGSVSLEALVALQPDLIFLGGDYQRLLADQLSKLQVPVLSFESQSVADIEHSIRGISRSTGHVESGETLIRKIKQDIAALQARVKPYQKQGEPRVFYQVWDQPLMTAGPASFIGELIDLIGGENVFADVEIAYPQVSEETLILRNPDVILMPYVKGGPTDVAASLRTLNARPGWKEMNAVKNKRLYIIEDDLISRPGPRVVQGLQKIAQALYPEAFQQQ